MRFYKRTANTPVFSWIVTRDCKTEIQGRGWAIDVSALPRNSGHSPALWICPLWTNSGHMKKETALKAASLKILIRIAKSDQPLV
jgi:hypothetical protein